MVMGLCPGLCGVKSTPEVTRPLSPYGLLNVAIVPLSAHYLLYQHTTANTANTLLLCVLQGSHPCHYCVDAYLHASYDHTL